MPHAKSSQETSSQASEERSGLLRVLVLAAQPVEGEALALLLSTSAGVDAQWVASTADARRLLRSDLPTVMVWTTRTVDREAALAVCSLWDERRVALVLLVDALDRDSITELVTHGAPCIAVVRRAATPSVDDLVHALHEVHAGRSSLDPEILATVLAGNGPEAVMDRLTDAEREVADLVAQGLRNETIGKRLFKSERTVEKHVASVFDKLGLCHHQHPHLDRRVATARIVLADRAGEPLAPEALDDLP